MAAHTARTALLEAITHGREAPAIIRTRIPSSDASPPPCLSGLSIEDLEYQSDDGLQGWVPLRLASLPKDQQPPRRLPTIVLLHPTGSDMSFAANWQASFARRGYLAAAIDTRYHGARVDPSISYQETLVRAWRNNSLIPGTPSNEHPFLLDNVWDLMRLVDLLSARPDVDPARIGVSGFSLGGMHSWLLAAADIRIAAAAPVAGVQFFKHAIDTNQYMSRVESIPLVFYAAAEALGKEKRRVDAEVVEHVAPPSPRDARRLRHSTPFSSDSSQAISNSKWGDRSKMSCGWCEISG